MDSAPDMVDMVWVMLMGWINLNIKDIVNDTRFARIIEWRLAHHDPDPHPIEYGTDCRVVVHHFSMSSFKKGPFELVLNVATTNLEVYNVIAAKLDYHASWDMRIMHDGRRLPYTGFFADFDPEDGMDLYVTLF